MHITQILHTLDLFGTGVFAISGALAARRKQMDVFGVMVLAFVTALGGGTLRDLLLDCGPVFWIGDRSYITMVAVTAFLSIVSIRLFSVTGRWLLISDALGLAVFTIIGAQKALVYSGSYGVAVIMGITTGVAGGMVRDVLSAEVPLILRKEIYATAAFCGALIFVLLNRMAVPEALCVWVSILTTLIIRLSAIHWKLSLPVPVAYPADRSAPK